MVDNNPERAGNVYRVKPPVRQKGQATQYETLDTILQAWLKANPERHITFNQLKRAVLADARNKFYDQYGKLCDHSSFNDSLGIRAGQDIYLPEGNAIEGDAYLNKCEPAAPPTKVVASTPPLADAAPVAAPPPALSAPAQTPNPTTMRRAASPAQPSGVRQPFMALPQHMDPKQLEQLRIQNYLLVGSSDPASIAARRQVDRAHAAGTWQGPDPMHLDGQFGSIGATIGAFFPPSGMLIGAVAGTAVDVVALNTSTNLQSDLVARQPNAFSRVNMLEGWQLDGRGIPVRINPNDRLNQPDQSHNTDGLISGRYTLSTEHPNWDSATQARISERLAAPNVQSGLAVIQYLQPKIASAYNTFHANPTKENGERVLNLVAAAAATDVAQMSGTVDAMLLTQKQVVAEAAARNITLNSRDLRNPASIPGLNALGVSLEARSYDEMVKDPGFADNRLSREEYDARFAGRNLNSIYEFARTPQNSVTAAIGRGGNDVVTPTAPEAAQLAADAIGFVDRNAATRKVFRGLVRHDRDSAQPHQFALIVNKSLNDMVHNPQTWGFDSQLAAIDYATSLVGPEVVQNQYLQPTATPEPGSDGRTRDAAATGAAFARTATDAGISDWLQRIKTHPMDRDAPENRTGVFAQALTHQFALQGNEQGFHAISAAGKLTPAERERFHTDITRMASYEVSVDRGGRHTTEAVTNTGILANAGAGVRQYTMVKPDGKTPVAGQAVTDGIATRNEAVGAIQQARARGDNKGATRLAANAIMKDPGMAAVALEGMGAYDRGVALNLVLEGMARNPDVFQPVMGSVRTSQRSYWFGKSDVPIVGDILNLFGSNGDRGEFVNRLEKTVDQYRAANELRGEERERAFATARQGLDGYLARIDDARAGIVYVVRNNDYGNEFAGQDIRAPRDDWDYAAVEKAALARRANGNGRNAGGVVLVEQDGTAKPLTGDRATAVQRMIGPNAAADQYNKALAGQDAIIATMQAIGSNPQARDETRGAALGHMNGVQGLSGRQGTVTGSQVAAAVVGSGVAAHGQQTSTGGLQAKSVHVNPESSAGMVAATNGDAIYASLQKSLKGMTLAQIEAGMQPGAIGKNAARVQAALVAAAPGATEAQMQAIKDQIANISMGSRIDTAQIQTNGYFFPTKDALLIALGGIVRVTYPTPHHSTPPNMPRPNTPQVPTSDPQLPIGGVPGGGTPSIPRPIISPQPVTPPAGPTPITLVPPTVPTQTLPSVGNGVGGGGAIPFGRPGLVP